jgi:hypothetical protein
MFCIFMSSSYLGQCIIRNDNPWETDQLTDTHMQQDKPNNENRLHSEFVYDYIGIMFDEMWYYSVSNYSLTFIHSISHLLPSYDLKS